MRLSNGMQKSLNEQVRKEFNAWYLYLAMSAWFGERNFEGFAKWMRLQAGEEQGHAFRIFDYILDRDASVHLAAVDQPKPIWKTPLEVFDAAAKHEAAVSAGIKALYEQAGKEKDYSTQVMLQWFLTEQVEEERTSTAIVERVRLVGESAAGLLMLDRELGARGPE